MPQTPSLPDTLLTLKPYIHGLAVSTRLLQWKPYSNTDNSSSIPLMLLVILLWTSAWFHHKLLLGVVVPLVLVYVLTTMHDQPPPKLSRLRRRQSNSYTADNNLDDEAANVAEITKELAELSELLSFTISTSKSFNFDRKSNIVVCSCLTLFWQYIIHSARLGHLVWFTGCVFLTWWSPWVHTVRQIIQQQHERRQQQQKKLASLSVTETKRQELDRMYCFSVYENQRWWLHCGWTDLMLPHDRPEWSDEYLESTPSIDTFSLPPPSNSSHWEWVDPSWKSDLSGVKDDDGWEYGNWDWKAWSNKRSGLSILTRRRRWIRCARLEGTDTDDAESVAASSAASTCSSPSLLFSPKPRPTSLLTHRTLSSITTISSTSSSSCEPPKECGTHLWLHK